MPYPYPALVLTLMLPLAFCAQALDVPIVDQSGHALADAVVYAVGNNSEVPKATPAVIDQVNKRFQPLVTAVTVGSPISFPNSDAIRHHVYSLSPANRFELKLYHGVPSEPVVFAQSGVVTLGCNIHDSMIAYVRVLPTATFAISSQIGQVNLDQLGVEGASIGVWHPFQQGHDVVVPVSSEQTRLEVVVPIDMTLRAQIEAAIR